MARCAMCLEKRMSGRWIKIRKCIGSRVDGVEAVTVQGFSENSRRFFICNKCKKDWKSGESACVIIDGKTYAFHI